jgi:hypothetical protein
MTIKKKGLSLDNMIDTDAEAADTGVPQRGSYEPPRLTRRPRRERRGDQMSIRMTTTTRNKIITLADEFGVPIAEIVERAIAQYNP